MILPLHHCGAIACDVLVDPGLHFCAAHLQAIPVDVTRLLANAATPQAIEVACDLAIVHLAAQEGRIKDYYPAHVLPPPAASQEEPTHPTVPGDAVMKAHS